MKATIARPCVRKIKWRSLQWMKALPYHTANTSLTPDLSFVLVTSWLNKKGKPSKENTFPIKTMVSRHVRFHTCFTCKALRKYLSMGQLFHTSHPLLSLVYNTSHLFIDAELARCKHRHRYTNKHTSKLWEAGAFRHRGPVNMGRVIHMSHR